MKQQEIIEDLYQKHSAFINFLTSLNEKDFVSAPVDKWNAGQQLDHILRAVKPLTQALLFPKFLLKLLFSTSNRTSRTYEGLVKKYLAKLAGGGRATGRFIPRPAQFEQKDKLAKDLLNAITQLSRQLNNYTEEELDTYILPHPLLGKLTIREMMYFTIYHVEHHHQISVRNLDKN